MGYATVKTPLLALGNYLSYILVPVPKEIRKPFLQLLTGIKSIAYFLSFK